jgi:alanyl-tRNA synthetase
MITAQDLRQKFLDFFESKEHAILPSASLLPDNDPTTLFITAGMHPLVPYLLGQPHPAGKRLASIQKCVRTTDIDEVGDPTHLTFFEMLGNWSLGDYFKPETIAWSWEFLTSPTGLDLDKEKLFVSVFAGDEDAPRDDESIAIWQDIFQREGISHPEKRIFKYPKSENWWGPAGMTGPCGPDTEIFYYTGADDPFAPDFSDEPAADNSDFIEIWNNVFMQYNKQSDGDFIPLSQHNVDTGLGLERMLAILNWIQGELPVADLYQTQLFKPSIELLEKVSDKSYLESDSGRSMRIMADHLRSAVFMVQDGVVPANKERGYILRRLIRRAVRELHKLGVEHSQFNQIIEELIKTFTDNPEYVSQYPEIQTNQTQINQTIVQEVSKFTKSLAKGLREAEKHEQLTGEIAFQLYQTYGFPLEMTVEIAQERGQQIEVADFQIEFKNHQELSRQQSAGTFKGGLADHSAVVTRFHTATHLLHSALRQVLGDHVHQEGSNITADRLRFDFSHPQALTDTELQQVENWINDQIKADLPVSKSSMPKDEALESGALAFFKEKYPNIVTVYTIGDEDKWVSRELCGGPHVSHTSEIGEVEIFKQKASSAGVRRVYLRFKE